MVDPRARRPWPLDVIVISDSSDNDSFSDGAPLTFRVSRNQNMKLLVTVSLMTCL